MSRTCLRIYIGLLNLKRRPLPREERGWSEHAQYLEDGSVISDRMGHFNFVVRALYGAANYFALQLPENYRVLIDMDQYINSFTIVNNNGERVSADPWRLGPGFRRVKPATSGADHPSYDSRPGHISESEFVDQEIIRSEMRQKWANYYHRVAAHIPYEVAKANGEEALRSDDFMDDTDLEMGEVDTVEGDGIDGTTRPNYNAIAPPISGKGGRPERKCLFHLL